MSEHGDRTLSPTDLKRLHRQWRKRTELRLTVVLDGVQNPYNVGAIVRSAAAYRVERLWLAGPTIGLDHPKVAKTALGCERLVQSEVVDTATEAVGRARTEGFTAVAVELTERAEPLFEIDLGPAVCLVVGHEERGVHRDTLAAVDHVGFLPQLGRVGSLNVAQATTTALYEAATQAWRRDR